MMKGRRAHPVLEQGGIRHYINDKEISLSGA
jgi:hypothetical protein